ncbi:4Fe-4S binding protein [Geomonas edaphica]|uniref:4Fe-4S binding protein n=1 Tax=Geomonas edaphica TaxID=2570226 RepID=UPI0010A92A89|nr:4Fe-4S binding protein [Geomonas edaphica]
MNQTIHLIYFSPTGTTRKTVTAIAQGLGTGKVVHHDLTRVREGIDLTLDEGIAVIGFPVYAGRVPELFLQRIERLQAAGMPVVIAAVYGNRAFEDALLEMAYVCRAKGFSVSAAGAFIGEHSYASDSHPVALGRPDRDDLGRAVKFGTLASRAAADPSRREPQIPGAFPYKERPPLGGAAPDTDEGLCTLCGACAEVCPTFVIEIGDAVRTNAAGCIKCCACTRVCPPGARVMNHPSVAERRQMLVDNCSRRKVPDFFL